MSDTANTPSTSKDPIGLGWLLVIGIAVSLVAIAVVMYFLLAYETASFAWWEQPGVLSQDDWFAVIRNAVTLVAALGLAATLFLSYRRQQAAEQTLRLTAEAQKIAADAQKTGVEVQKTAAAAQETASKNFELANRNFELVSKKHDLEVVGALRDRYARAAEQLASEKTAVRLAGLHALSALADEWYDRTEFEEQDLCIDLFCSVLRTEPVRELEGEEQFAGSPFLEAGWQILSERMGEGKADRKSWASKRLELQRAVIPDIEDWELNGGEVRLKQVTACDYVFSQLRIIDGVIDIEGLRRAPDRQTVGFFQILFEGGNLFIGDTDPQLKGINFLSCTFDGSVVSLFETVQGQVVRFVNCTFTSGMFNFRLSEGEDGQLFRILFENCSFTSPVVQIITKVPEVRVFTDFDERCSFAGAAEDMRDDPRKLLFKMPNNSK